MYGCSAKVKGSDFKVFEGYKNLIQLTNLKVRILISSGRVHQIPFSDDFSMSSCIIDGKVCNKSYNIIVTGLDDVYLDG